MRHLNARLHGAIASALMAILSASAAETEPMTSPNLHYYYPVPKAEPAQVVESDLCVYGSTPGGIAAAIQMRRMGKTSVLLSFGKHVGGMTSGGLSATDVGNKDAIGGMAREFYERLGTWRGFRPSAAETTLRKMLEEAKVPLYIEQRLKSVKKNGARIVEVEMENGNVFRAKMFVDATYEGDLYAKAGVSFHVGREANATYGETINGIHFKGSHQFLYPVDPYKTPGDPKSGLLWGVSDEAPGEGGAGDTKVQAYNFRMFLSDAPDRIPFPKPTEYDASHYALLARYLPLRPKLEWKFNYPDGPFQLMNGDCNNAGGFSTDLIGGNYEWPEADYPTRERIFQAHVSYQQGLMYFMSHDPSVPEVLRERVRRFGLAKGEFPETGGWPHELYVREGRRMVSDYVMTEKNCRGQVVAEDSVGLASYNMDSHNVRRLIIGGVVRNEGDVQVKSPQPYPISFRAIVPKASECDNLLVPVCLSASHVAYGSIRMEPVFMILGQSSGTAAALAIERGVSIQKIEYAELKERLRAGQQILDWVTGKKPKQK